MFDPLQLLNNSIILITIAPALFLIFIIYINDRYDREPLLLVLMCFVAGAFSTVLALVMESSFVLVFGFAPITVGWMFSYTIVGIGLPEQLAKLIATYFIAFKDKAFNEPMDGIVYTVAAGMGFATLENVLYITDMGYQIGLLRGVISLPMHMLFDVVLGYFVGMAHNAYIKKQSYVKWLFTGLMLAAVIHGFYDFIIYSIADEGLMYAAIIIFYALLVLFAIILVRKALSASPFKKAAE